MVAPLETWNAPASPPPVTSPHLNYRSGHTNRRSPLPVRHPVRPVRVRPFRRFRATATGYADCSRQIVGQQVVDGQCRCPTPHVLDVHLAAIERDQSLNIAALHLGLLAALPVPSKLCEQDVFASRDPERASGLAERDRLGAPRRLVLERREAREYIDLQVRPLMNEVE